MGCDTILLQGPLLLYAKHQECQNGAVSLQPKKTKSTHISESSPGNRVWFSTNTK